MVCLQIYRELSLATFPRVHSNLEEVSYVSWQNTYPNLKTTCHIKLKFFLWTKLVENLFLVKHLRSVAAPLKMKARTHTKTVSLVQFLYSWSFDLWNWENSMVTPCFWARFWHFLITTQKNLKDFHRKAFIVSYFLKLVNTTSKENYCESNIACIR